MQKITELGSSGFLVQADVCQPEDIRRMFQQMRSEFGSLDIFVSNARTEAATFYQAPMDITLDKWNTAVDSQAKAFLIGVREAVPMMSNGGRIIAITFAPGGRFGSWQPWVAMGAAKAAMEVLVRYFAVALASRKPHPACTECAHRIWLHNLTECKKKLARDNLFTRILAFRGNRSPAVRSFQRQGGISYARVLGILVATLVLVGISCVLLRDVQPASA